MKPTRETTRNQTERTRIFRKVRHLPATVSLVEIRMYGSPTNNDFNICYL